MKNLYLLILLISFSITKTIAKPSRNGPRSSYDFSQLFAFQFTKSFISKGSSLGLNYYRYYQVDKCKKTDLKNTFTFAKRYYISGLHLNHHFNGNSTSKYLSQSLELTFYKTKQLKKFTGQPYKMLGIGLNFRHYDFKYYTISPVLKIKPPLSVIYFQRNIRLNNANDFNCPLYEFGIELNFNLFINLMNHIDLD